MAQNFFILLDKLRQKPESFRRQIAGLLAGAITVIVFLLWLWNLQLTAPVLPTSFNEKEVSGDTGALARIKNGWQILLERFKN